METTDFLIELLTAKQLEDAARYAKQGTRLLYGKDANKQAMWDHLFLAHLGRNYS